jgi:hypothetical protein
MEYISVNNYDSELYKKSINIKFNDNNMIAFIINNNEKINLKKRAIKKLLLIIIL